MTLTTRRRAMSLLCGSLQIRAASTGRLSALLPPSHGCALLMDASTGRLLASNDSPYLNAGAFPPGSAIKPFVLASLITSGKLRPDVTFYCPQRLEIAGRTMDCSHPPLGTAMRIDLALAWSCNCFVAHVAERFAPGALAMALRSWGFSATTVLNDQRLQALGEVGIDVTAMQIANAYRRLARQSTPKPVLAGLEGAVNYGTAQLARVPWTTVAGKTGSARRGNQFFACFTGFAPSRAPEVVVSVIVAGKHGSSDAAPIARDVLNAWKAGRL